MAIFKPTDCSPFNGTFDIDADLPIIFECKVDTSNSKVTGYSIEIYNSDNKLVFPSSSESSKIGPMAANVTYLSDLKPYASQTFPNLIPTSKNINSGLNGTYLEIPFYVQTDKKADSTNTASRNQMTEGTEGLADGQTYTWKITLYQEVTKKGTEEVFPPEKDQYYDMAVANGTVIGSTEKRIQTALIDSDDDVVDGLVLIDKFLQPIKIVKSEEDPSPIQYSPSEPKSWAGEVPDNFSMSRSLITGYDSSYGYIYPSTAADNAFVEGQITPENANGFQIFKNGNNPSNLGATDMVEFIYDEDNFAGTIEWSTNIAKPELSYWEQTYITTDKPNGAYYPFSGGYSTYPLAGEERIIFNAMGKSSVTFSEGKNAVYYGSPFNGIFRPTFSYKEIEKVSDESENKTIPAGTYVFADRIDFSKTFTSPEKLLFKSNGLSYVSIAVNGSRINYKDNDGASLQVYSIQGWQKEYKIITVETAQTVSAGFYNWFSGNTINYYEVTVTWNRTTDASNWGTLSNKIVYCRRDGKNYEINSVTQIGTINETPFKFVDEKPVRLFAGKSVPDEICAISTVDGDSGIYRIQTINPISELISVTHNGVDVTKDCIFSVGERDIIYKTKNTVDVKTATVKYKQYDVKDYTGIIFYNSTGYLYIRPSINVNKSMIFKELTADSSYIWFNIKDFNKDYNYITYGTINFVKTTKSFSPIPDKTRYQIKTFYKESDYNPFSIYKDPVIESTILNGVKNTTNNELENVVLDPNVRATISVRNFTVVSTYEQSSYIQWKSFQWFLYDSRKLSVLESTDEQYDGEISGTFYGLEPMTNYILSLVLQTNSGKIIKVDYPIRVKFEEKGDTHGITKIEFDCDTLSVKADVNLFVGVIAPFANKYYSKGTGAPETGTAYYWNDNSNMYVKDGQTVGKVENVENGVLEISGNNSLEFENMFLDHEISDDTAKSNILIDEKDHGTLVLEGSFSFSENYQGNIFSIQDENTTTKSISINIPAALTNADADGFVDITDDINKVGVTGPGSAQSYLKISNADGTTGDLWQSLAYHRTSIWKQNGTVSANFGNRINVANFRYAESPTSKSKDGVPYPYDENSGNAFLLATDGTKVYWNQMINTANVETKTSDGVTFENNGDGTITVRGKNTSSGPVEYIIQTGMGEKGHIYMSFGCPNGGGYGSYRMACTAHIEKDGKQNYSGGFSDNGDGKIFVDKDSKKIRALKEDETFDVSISIGGGYDIGETDPLVFSPQIFDLTKMFGSGNEPQTVEDFWNRVAEVYFSPGLNVVGPYNSYDEEFPLKNTINPAEQPVDFYVGSKPFAVRIDPDDKTNTKEFCVNQPDRMVWLDYAPLPKQYPIVTNANLEDDETTVTVTTQNMSVLNDEEPLMWDDSGRWKDGIYVSSGAEAATLGQVLLNGEVVEGLTISIAGSSPTYSASGLTSQVVVLEKISEREPIAGYNFSFRIFIDTQTFTVDKDRSRCYVSKINVTKANEGGDLI